VVTAGTEVREEKKRRRRRSRRRRRKQVLNSYTSKKTRYPILIQTKIKSETSLRR